MMSDSSVAAAPVSLKRTQSLAVSTCRVRSNVARSLALSQATSTSVMPAIMALPPIAKTSSDVPSAVQPRTMSAAR